MIAKTDIPGIYKDGEGVLINKDSTGLKAYKLQKRQLHKNIALEEEVKMMKNDLAEIKELLKGLVNK